MVIYYGQMRLSLLFHNVRSLRLAQAGMAKQFSSCRWTCKCQQCKGTVRVGYSGLGPVDRYPRHGKACQASGDCLSSRGTGQR